MYGPGNQWTYRRFASTSAAGTFSPPFWVLPKSRTSLAVSAMASGKESTVVIGAAGTPPGGGALSIVFLGGPALKKKRTRRVSSPPPD